LARHDEDVAIAANSNTRAQALRALLTEGELEMLTQAERLSNQELAVFVMLGQGLKPKAIAYELAIGAKTVDTHIHRIRAKLCHERPLPLTDLLFLARMWVRAGNL
jgi:DNA-binding NarL/FixJ family response regulator